MALKHSVPGPRAQRARFTAPAGGCGPLPRPWLGSASDRAYTSRAGTNLASLCRARRYRGAVTAPAGRCRGGVNFVQETGLRNSAYGADQFGFEALAGVHWNLTPPALYQHAVAAHEATIVEGGALCAYRPLAQGQAYRCRRAHGRVGLVGGQSQDHAGAFPASP
jgi:hypothetical protein